MKKIHTAVTLIIIFFMVAALYIFAGDMRMLPTEYSEK